MKFLITAFLIFSSQYSHAFTNKSDVNYFEELKVLWDNGYNFNINQIANRLYSGRCFDYKLPLAPRNAALVVKTNRINYYNYELIGNVLYSPNKAPNYFDNLTFSDLRNFKNIPYYKVSSTSGSAQIYFPNNGKHQLRINGNFIISDFSVINAADDVGPIDDSKRTSTMRCYFFN